MNIKINFTKAYIMLVPVLGVGLFVLLYLISAKQYPGGSWNYTNDTGFSFWHNYLCDLLDEYAINGEINNGRFFARSALGILCVSIMLIWIYIPKLFVSKSHYLSVSRWSGLLSLIILFFLNFGTHDLIVRIAGFFGVVALFIGNVCISPVHMFVLLTFCSGVVFLRLNICSVSFYFVTFSCHGRTKQ